MKNPEYKQIRSKKTGNRTTDFVEIEKGSENGGMEGGEGKQK